ncbi:PDZ domain-containing protein [Polyangium sp. y55x31]|uniref:PDZ domain-containing protein n=1 Tax=Polyangium sp. y55x31 TaxID=3042688 RepID=UPI0024830C4D|nr:PDZ domain-containing protein [Polyangium sp. y55x31]MDI1482950.1 PDZ domain-containing protein [Polyangium sp. y55x31]
MNTKRLAPALVLATLLAAAAFQVGCVALYPEIGTNIRKITAEQALDPPPPDDLRWIRVVSGTIKDTMRDGRSWKQAIGKLPDPYAKLYINDQEVLRTNPKSETLEPSWDDAPRGNFQVSSADKMRVEIWDANTVTDKPIGVKEFRPTEDLVLGDRIRLDVPGAGEVVLAYERAHAMFGLGLWFELRTDTCFLTRMIGGSPAERAGAQPGDEVVQINGKEVTKMSSNAVRSAFNSIPSDGLPVVLRHADGTTASVTLREGPIYPTFAEFGQVD